MTDIEFQALMQKLTSLEYQIKNATSNTKILHCIESGETIALYNTPHTHGLYINNQKAQLNSQQESQMIVLIQEIVDGYSIEISQAEDELEYGLANALQNILDN